MLEWRDVDARTREVATTVGHARATVRMDLDEHGDVASVSTPARPALERGQTVERGWGGAFSAYGTVGGVRIPTEGEAWWEHPEGRRPYWRGRITALNVDDAL